MDSLPLFKNNQERKLFVILAFFIFSINLSLEFYNYKKFTNNEIYHVNGIITNIYHKENYNILKIDTQKFTIFTKYNKITNTAILHNIDLFIVTEGISFLSYLKGFYANSFNVHILNDISSKSKVYNYITNQHTNNDISSLYSALFLATAVTQDVRKLSTELGISHLIALSGFHLGIMTIVLYFIINLLYNKIHSRYTPYRNKKFDIMIIVSILLFIYMIFINTPASLLRAFCMFIFALYLLRNNIKVISFETLFIITIVIIIFFPKLIFSLSLWFSVTGVFYIFLFLKYFHNINKTIQFILFNIWIYLAINPIIHYFFPITTQEQIYSPILSILFSLFYPLSALLHLFSYGDTLDVYIEVLLDMEFYNYEIYTEIWFLILYILVGFISIVRREVFFLLNIFLISYNIWLFHFMF